MVGTVAEAVPILLLGNAFLLHCNNFAPTGGHPFDPDSISPYAHTPSPKPGGQGVTTVTRVADAIYERTHLTKKNYQPG